MEVGVKILWTFNPFDKNRELYSFGKNILTHLFDKKDLIEVIYVASNAEAELATSFNIPIEKRYSDYPKKIIKEELKKLSLESCKIKILFEKSLSLTASVKKVVGYTKKNKVDLIVIATNAKKNLPKAIFGSFAETMIHLSICDILIYHQGTRFDLKKPENIVYAHDFTLKGDLGLKRLIKYIKKWDSFLTIVHVPIPSVGTELHDFKDSMKRKAQKIQSLMVREKIKCKICLEYEVRPISEILLEIGDENKGGMIVLTAQSSKLTAFLGGSITRQVLRESTLPTMVLKV